MAELTGKVIDLHELRIEGEAADADSRRRQFLSMYEAAQESGLDLSNMPPRVVFRALESMLVAARRQQSDDRERMHTFGSSKVAREVLENRLEEAHREDDPAQDSELIFSILDYPITPDEVEPVIERHRQAAFESLSRMGHRALAEMFLAPPPERSTEAS